MRKYLMLKEMRKYVLIQKCVSWNDAENFFENSKEKQIISEEEDLIEELVFWYLSQIFSDELNLK